MLARRITLCNFRNIREASVCFDEGVNVLYGDNAEGKTNLLEAVYYASIGKSFRGQHTAEVISFGENEASLTLDFKRGEREQSITLRFLSGRIRTVEKNKVKLSRMSELVGSFRAVLFCPEHLSLIKDGPSERRNFLDIAISAAEPLYLGALQRYHRILKQRNALIKSAEKDPDGFQETVSVWSEQLATEGAFIASRRAAFIKRAEQHLKEIFADMTGTREIPTLAYLGCGGREFSEYDNVEQTKRVLLRKLSDYHERELGAGATLYGIHKDDLEVELNGRSARLYCSQGQQRSLALALKLAEGELCRADCGEYPVLLLDDVLSELDAGRREIGRAHV